MGVNVGDRVQIRDGGIDVTNGKKARAGYRYGEGGPDFATVEAIVENWNTGGRWGLPNRVTKVRCSNSGVVVWQVQPQDIAGQKVDASQPAPVPAKPVPPPSITIPGKPRVEPSRPTKKYPNSAIGASKNPYAILKGSEVWSEDGGVKTQQNTDLNTIPDVTLESSKVTDETAFRGTGAYPVRSSFKTIDADGKMNADQIKKTGSKNVSIDKKIQVSTFSTAWEETDKRNEMLNKKKGLIQNSYNFPFYVGQSGNLPAKYDYRILVGDHRYTHGPTYNLEDKLMELRTELGIPVHGNNQIAKAMKYYMYNRYKIPDKNLAHNKTVTHVFFTRPDLNLLKQASKEYTANEQIMNHTEAAMLWRRHPELFKLLSDRSHCGDENNFNLLLSNQVQSFDIQDETLTTNRAGKSWNEYEMQYGDAYSGRTAGEFSCEFLDTSEFEIINLMKLWITYIDNVARGAWSPSYSLSGMSNTNINASHVYSKTLDYASSAYVFKCGPDGEDVLYWSKYYGIFPINTGANALSWSLGTPIGDPQKLNIRFAYCYKRDMSPISLIEFNNASGVTTDNPKYEPAFNVKLGHTGRPYVGAPFIEIDLGYQSLTSNDVNRTDKRTQIRLKFRRDNKQSRSDSILFKAEGRLNKNQL